MNSKCEYVMVIDDNNIDLYITSRIIKSMSFSKHILQYSSAEEALAYLRNNAGNKALLPKVIIVDIYMPIMSGFEFMAQYNQLPRTLKSYCKVFIVSSTIDKEDITRANEDKNVVAFQEKPINAHFLNSICT